MFILASQVVLGIDHLTYQRFSSLSPRTPVPSTNGGPGPDAPWLPECLLENPPILSVVLAEFTANADETQSSDSPP